MFPSFFRKQQKENNLMKLQLMIKENFYIYKNVFLMITFSLMQNLLNLFGLEHVIKSIPPNLEKINYFFYFLFILLNMKIYKKKN